MARVNLPYGIDNFAKVRGNDCYYIDKTGFIKELLDRTFDVNLITRPRRFGKTLTMSMLAEFFDIRKGSRAIFDGLEISEDADLCAKWMNQWPVLFLTLKDVDGDGFEDAYGLLEQTIAKQCMEHSYLLKSDHVEPADAKSFSRLMYRKGSLTDVRCSLDTLLLCEKPSAGRISDGHLLWGRIPWQAVPDPSGRWSKKQTSLNLRF